MVEPEPSAKQGVEGIEAILDSYMPNWESTYGEDLFIGMDVRSAVMRTRAFCVWVESQAALGALTVTGLSPAGAAAMLAKTIREQLEGPDMVGTRRPPAAKA